MSLVQDIDGILDTAQRRSRSDDVLAPFKAELAQYVEQMRDLTHMHPDDAMAWLSSVSARVLQMLMTTLDHEGRLITKWRVEALIPLRDELRFQFQIASRRHSVTEMDLKLSGGQPT